MGEGSVVKIRWSNSQDEDTIEEIMPGTPECIRHEDYEKEFKRLLTGDYEDAPKK